MVTRYFVMHATVGDLFSIFFNLVPSAIKGPGTECGFEMSFDRAVVPVLIRLLGLPSHVGNMNDLNAKPLLHQFGEQLSPGSACLEEQTTGAGGYIGLRLTYTMLKLAFVHTPNESSSATRPERRANCNQSAMARFGGAHGQAASYRVSINST